MLEVFEYREYVQYMFPKNILTFHNWAWPNLFWENTNGKFVCSASSAENVLFMS
jgi:hypothetical protein